MNLGFPLLPLPYVLSSLEVVHGVFALLCALLGGIFGLAILVVNVKNPDRETARSGYIWLGIALVGWVFGAYILLAALAAAVIWFIVYKFLIKFVIWRVFIKNAIIAVRPEKSEGKKEEG